MSEQQVLPEFIATLKAVAARDTMLGKQMTQKVAVEVVKLIDTLAQSEAERERLQEAYEQSTYSLGMKVIETATLRAELAREREANQGLRQVVKQYREEHEIHSGCDDEFGLCTICKQADALLEPKSKPVATTS